MKFMEEFRTRDRNSSKAKLSKIVLKFFDRYDYTLFVIREKNFPFKQF